MSGIRDDLTIDVVDDTGTGRDGTRVDEIWWDDFLDALDGWILDPSNPTVKPKDTTSEVITARGAYDTLDERLDDFALAADVADVITETQFMGGLGGVNLVRNDDFLLWPDGDASAPLYYALAGAGASIARAGTGLGDSNRKIGDFCAKVTRGGADVTLSNTLLSGTAFTRADFLKGKYVAVGMWVKSSTPNLARIGLSDGAGSQNSSYHTGGGAWEFLTATRQIDNSATGLIPFGQVNNADAVAYFSGLTVILLNSNFALVQYQPGQVIYGALHFAFGGTLATGLNLARFGPSRGGIVKDAQLIAKTAPVGADLIFDINTWDGAAFTSMFSSALPTIADGDNYGGSQPDGTYARRCFRGLFGDTPSAGGVLSVDIDQVGSGTEGADADLEVRTLQYASPLERFADYNG